MKLFLFAFLQMLAINAVTAQMGTQKDSLVHPSGKADSALLKVETESSFPGGEAGWIRFLNSNLVYPPKAVRKKVEGTVIVQFIVEKDGSISNIEALSGPELLHEAAVKVLKESPNWKPAFQFGRKVKSYKKQPITFRLTN